MCRLPRSLYIVALWLPLSLGGCRFGPPRVDVPGIDPERASAEAVKLYDSDQDQSISREESLACPALEVSFDLYDANTDDMLSEAEIASRLQAMLDTGIGRMPCMCVVYANGNPVVGANVQMTPEPFLEGVIQPGHGTTNERGIAKPVTVDAPPGLPGVEFGLYRVSITHDEFEIPAKYNTETELGFELSPIERDRDTAQFQLKL